MPGVGRVLESRLKMTSLHLNRLGGGGGVEVENDITVPESVFSYLSLFSNTS